MKKEHYHILQHALGVTGGNKRVYRNHFAAGSGEKDYELCKELVLMGYMQDMGPMEVWDGMHCFIVTQAGWQLIRDRQGATE